MKVISTFIYIVTLLLILTYPVSADNMDTTITFSNYPIGFASVSVLGQNGTAGGEGGDTVVFTSGESLNQFLYARKDAHFNKNYPPKICIIRGKLTWTTKEMMDVKETYDLTIIGEGSDAIIEGFGLNVMRSHNIIIRNIEFRNCPDDAICIKEPESHHVWVDHCTFSDSPESDPSAANHDGLLDITTGASFITVSWNHFYNHHKTCLLGNSDYTAATDSGKLKTTYHHNWFEDTNSRHPRVRFGECHVFNNFYDGKGTMSYGIASTMEADVIVEGCYFKKVGHPTYVGYEASGPGDLVEKYNVFENSGTPQTRGTAFNPSNYYNYTLSSASILPVIIPQYSGNGKLNNTPLPVQLGAFKIEHVSTENNNLLLLWTTISEINNKGFEILRSRDKHNWDQIGFVKGKGSIQEKSNYKFLDNTFKVQGKYYYCLKQLDYDGNYEFSNILEISIEHAKQEFKLLQNYPNPFNPETNIDFILPVEAEVALKIFNIAGEEIRDLVKAKYAPGTYRLKLDKLNIASGMYIYKFSAVGIDGSNFVQTKKMILLQ